MRLFYAGVMFLFLFLYCYALVASELQVWYANSSTRIVLSKTPCDNNGYRAAAQSTDNTFVKGCWVFTKENMIKIRWKDGDFTEVNPDLFNEVKQQFTYRYK